MKLERLDLLAFGSLRELSLELAESAPCLHVIYGPNEAGKSTALRALSGLFYGIPENTKDAHSIEPSKLKVGALLRDAAGRELAVVRRKGRKDTLLGTDGQPLTAADAAWLTAGVAESTFHALFGLSFATLNSGAEELLGSAGDLGQSLFSAALGGGRVRRVLEQLEQEAGDLFKPRGRNQQLNAALASFDSARRKSRDDSTKQSTFSEQQAGIELAQADVARLHAQSLTLRTEREKLERARRVLPLLAKYRTLHQAREALGAVVRLAEDAPLERRQAESARRDAQLRFEFAQVEVTRLEQELAQLTHTVQPALAALHPSSIEALRDRLSGYRRCVRALPAKTEALARARAEVERALGRLQLPAADAVATSAIERLRLPKPVEARVRDQLRQGAALRTRLTELQRTAADKREQLDRLREKLTLLWGPQTEPAQAPLLARVTLPNEALCDQYERSLSELSQAQRVLERKQEDLETQLERNRAAREALGLSGVPPTEAELLQLRAARGELWSQLRVWLVERPAEQGSVPLLERAVALSERADGVADRLRREADRVAQAVQLTAEHASLERTRGKLTAEHKALVERHSQQTAAWQAHFHDAGLAPRSPREALGLLGKQRALEAQQEQLERELTSSERALAHDTRDQRTWAAAWQTLASELGVADHTGAAELEALLAARAELLERHDSAQALADEVSGLAREVTDFERDTTRLCQERLPELAEHPAELAAERLIEAHHKTHSALTRVEQLQTTLDIRREAGDQAQRELTQTERRLMLLMQAAGVEDAAGLEAAETKSDSARAIDTGLAQVTADLTTACDGQGLAYAEQVDAEVALPLDQVRMRLSELDDELEVLRHELTRAMQQEASVRAGLDRLHEKHSAGDAAAEALEHLDQVRTLTERYVRVKLAASVLKREIERYRERHRAPVLQAAADLFQRLTLQAYAGLDVDYGEHDEPVLVCVRADQKRLSVPALSTGTRDQLYLALRLASIQHLAANKELMPLILDDILVHFDDDRARAALVTLADFAATTQVLFFTHHQRLCELAREALAPERIRIHRLASAAIPVHTALLPL